MAPIHRKQEPALITANHPAPGQILLDHTGHFVSDAAAATDSLVALGFTVTPYSAQVQPDPDTGEARLTGTGNVCVMLDHGYLEFLVHTADTPIGLEFRAALDRRAGLHLSAFAVPDAAQRHADLLADGHPMRPLVRFSRDVETADGTETARFTVARLRAGTMPEGRVQVLTHHTVAAMWQDRWTAHPNTAHSLRSIIISAPDVDETAARFSRFLGVPAVPARAGQRIELSRGAVEILPEGAATDLTGTPVEQGRSVFVGLRIGVSDLSAIRGRTAAGVDRDGSLLLPFGPALGRGVWIFEQA